MPSDSAPSTGEVRKRAAAATAAKSKKRARDDDDEHIDENGRRWLNMFLLALFLGGPILTAVVFGWEYVATSSWGQSMGLSQTPRERLEEFYKLHNPEKLNDRFLDKTLRKWKGREDQLFHILELKYKREEA